MALRLELLEWVQRSAKIEDDVPILVAHFEVFISVAREGNVKNSKNMQIFWYKQDENDLRE